MKYFVRLYLCGLVVLAVAVILNLLSFQLNLDTWYSFLLNISEVGFFGAFEEVGFFSFLYLFFVYPFLLGASAILFWEYLNDKS